MKRIKHSFQMIIKVLAKFYFLRAYKVNYVFKDFDPKREGPYFLIGNHVHFLDALFCNFPIKRYSVPVASSFVFTSYWQRIALTVLIDSIVKRKGQSDMQTIRDIRKHIKKGHIINVYPEGNTSYYGDGSESVYSTAKLFKLQKIDVVCAKTKGSYLSKPRWRKTRTKKPFIEIEIFTLFKAHQLRDMTVDEIYQAMIGSYYQNDYEWNRDRKEKYIGKNRLEGVQRMIYACPECNSINHINSSGDTMFCEKCNSLGTINDYGFIQGTKYDNLVDWGSFQENLLRQKLRTKYEFDIELIKIDLEKFKKHRIGAAKLVYENKNFYIKSKDMNLTFKIKNIVGAVFTEYDEFSFDYDNETFMFITDKPKLLLDITKFIKEE